MATPSNLSCAILTPPDDNARLDTAHRLRRALEPHGFATAVLCDADSVHDGGFDFVVAMTALQPKLSACPSYALFDRADFADVPGAEAMGRLLSHDAYLVTGPAEEAYLADVLFGTRKRGSRILPWPVLAVPAALAARRSEVLLVPFSAPPSPEQRAFLQALAARRAVRVVAFESAAGAVSEALDTAVEPVPADGRALSVLAQGHAEALLLLSTLASCRLPFALLRATIAEAGCRLLDGTVDAPVAVLLRRIEAEAKEVEERKADSDSAAQALRALHEATLEAKGYRPGPTAAGPEPSVAYLVRTGGRSAWYLKRALTSLAAQGYPALRVVLVVWQGSEELDGVLGQPWPFPIVVVHDTGANRSRTLATGLRAIADSDAAYFGILDDDDEVHPNHVRSLLACLEQRRRLTVPRAEVAYAGSVEIVEDQKAAPLPRHQVPLPVPARRLRPGAFFFPNPARLWSPAVHMPPHAFLAATRLIDDDMLTDCRMPVGEDTHLLNLLAERSDFAFSCEVTAVYHFHGEGQSSWWERPVEDRVAERLGLRVLGRVSAMRAMYGGVPFPSVDHPLGTGVPEILFVPPAEARPATDGPAVSMGDGVANGETLVLSVGGYQALWYFDGLPDERPASVRLPNGCGLRVDAVPAVLPGRRSWRIAHRFLVERDLRLAPGELRLEWPGGPYPAPLGLRVEAVAEGWRLPWSRFAETSGRIWIFGAGSAGRAALGHLTRLGLASRIVGFIDSHCGGHIDGLPVRPPSDLEAPSAQTDVILIASQHWEEIRRQLAKAGRRGVYSSHPINPACLWFLP
ncbi:glycosyltransferase [Azospirillum doebereinerae]|uniref:glycosyltransferase family 2 protein n=1 Tax=Azospirillum doebereinerae TaxID=92933 RepID=UPI001EE56553|nr:glycosyltransferase family 2 protein [Azospirillum doebereinerae]MCG5238891.1 glycosyltransferase [Azospirillum doebereinerae]